MRTRKVILTIQTIGALIRDYLGDQIPPDAELIGIRINQKEHGKLGVVFQANSFKRGAEPKLVRFDIKRSYSV